MAFDPVKWIQQSGSTDNEKIVKVAGEEVRIRRLQGTEWERYLRATGGQSEDSAIVVLLQHGMCRPFGQYTYEQMEKFYNSCPMLADKIAGLIVEFSTQRYEAELQFLEDAEKNSETTESESPSTDGAESSVKTHEPQE